MHQSDRRRPRDASRETRAVRSDVLLPELFVIDDEVIGNRRSPDIERILRRMVGRGPVEIGGNEIDVERILGPAAPRILDVVEIIRAEYMAPDAPAFRKSLRLHQLGAEADVVEAAH